MVHCHDISLVKGGANEEFVVTRWEKERERELRGDEGDKGCEAMEEKGKKEEDVRKGCFAGPANGISL